MMQEGDRLTEIILQKERLQCEKEEIEDQEDTRLIEIEYELDDILLEADSIT